MHPNSPSIHITTAELADVVTGSEDRPLPDWATDRAFEAELQSLIEENSVVSICWHCDSVISFFHDPEQGISIVPELALVAQSEKIPCPYCGTPGFAFYDPKVLTTGEKVRATGIEDEERPEWDESAETDQDLSAKVLPPNERFLDQLLRTKYGVRLDGPTDAFRVSKGTLERIAEQFTEMVSAWKTEPNLPNVDANALARLFDSKQYSLSLRPQIGSPLGDVWRTVREIIAVDYPEYCDVAVGIAISPGISASTHLGDSGEMAVIVEMGLFSKLPRLNRLLSRMFDTDLLHGSETDIRPRIDDTVMSVIAELTDNLIDPANLKSIPMSGYESHAEFLRSRLTTKHQLVFSILHELGHLADWRSPSHTNHHRTTYPMERSAVIEAKADSWAMDLILRRGESSDVPWVYTRSLFWLFEYWHVMAVGFGYPNAACCDSRKRWDNVESIIRSSREDVDFGLLCVDEVRTIFDLMIDRMEAR